MRADRCRSMDLSIRLVRAGGRIKNSESVRVVGVARRDPASAAARFRKQSWRRSEGLEVGDEPVFEGSNLEDDLHVHGDAAMGQALGNEPTQLNCRRPGHSARSSRSRRRTASSTRRCARDSLALEAALAMRVGSAFGWMSPFTGVGSSSWGESIRRSSRGKDFSSPSPSTMKPILTGGQRGRTVAWLGWPLERCRCADSMRGRSPLAPRRASHLGQGRRVDPRASRFQASTRS